MPKTLWPYNILETQTSLSPYSICIWDAPKAWDNVMKMLLTKSSNVVLARCMALSPTTGSE